ncbi:hypothetical protein BHM03_00002314 [Ensete ventricosum]|nr:hypothetical protein BHM03_00002314 [Ensete ventricosum]
MHERQRERHVLTRAAADVDVCFSLRESDGRLAETPTAEIGPWDGTKGQDGATGRSVVAGKESFEAQKTFRERRKGKKRRRLGGCRGWLLAVVILSQWNCNDECKGQT